MVSVGAFDDFRLSWAKLWDNSVMRTIALSLTTILLAIVLSGCAGFGGDSVQDESGKGFRVDQIPAQEELPKFSAQAGREGMPQGWNFYRIAPYKKNTIYRLENYQGRTVLSANSKTAASGLAVKLKPKKVSRSEEHTSELQSH